ncbi:MAG TPA: hypothetical protein VHD32_11025 [Candidatus Didemnitutus sp.]|nr:hypothetical protein [Candidatus Didemnitutus sp.]
MTRIDDVPRAIFFVGRSNHPTIVGAGATIGLTSWRLKQLKLGARGESPIATLTEDGTEKSVAMGVGQPLLAGESIAWIASGDDEGQLRRVGDSIAWDGSTWRIAAISEGPDEAVTFACGEKEWVFVAENEIAGGTVPANSPAPAILAVGGAAIRPEEQP